MIQSSTLIGNQVDPDGSTASRTRCGLATAKIRPRDNILGWSGNGGGGGLYWAGGTRGVFPVCRSVQCTAVGGFGFLRALPILSGSWGTRNSGQDGRDLVRCSCSNDITDYSSSVIWGVNAVYTVAVPSGQGSLEDTGRMFSLAPGQNVVGQDPSPRANCPETPWPINR